MADEQYNGQPLIDQDRLSEYDDLVKERLSKKADAATVAALEPKISGKQDKLAFPNNANQYLNGNGQWTTPANTDTNVTQTNTGNNAAYPILLKNGTGDGTVTTTALFDSGVTLNPSTNTITANITGNAATASSASTCTGNAASATTASSCTGNAATATTATNVTGVVGIPNGGTGKNNAAEAWAALGGGSVGKLNTNGNANQVLLGNGTWGSAPASTLTFLSDADFLSAVL